MTQDPGTAVRRLVAEARAGCREPATALRGVVPAVLDGVLLGTWYGTDADPRPVRRRRRAVVSAAWLAALTVQEGVTALRHPGGAPALAAEPYPPHERAYLARSVAVSAAWTVVGLAGEVPRRRLLRRRPSAHHRLGLLVGAGSGLTVLPVHLARAGAAAAQRASATGTR